MSCRSHGNQLLNGPGRVCLDAEEMDTGRCTARWAVRRTTRDAQRRLSCSLCLCQTLRPTGECLLEGDPLNHTTSRQSTELISFARRSCPFQVAPSTCLHHPQCARQLGIPQPSPSDLPVQATRPRSGAPTPRWNTTHGACAKSPGAVAASPTRETAQTPAPDGVFGTAQFGRCRCLNTRRPASAPTAPRPRLTRQSN